MAGDHYSKEQARKAVEAAKAKAADAAARESHSEVSLRIESSREGIRLLLIVYTPRRGSQRLMRVIEDVVWKTAYATEDELLSWGVRALMRHAAVQLELPFEQ
jgi:hypothetical protein